MQLQYSFDFLIPHNPQGGTLLMSDTHLKRSREAQLNLWVIHVYDVTYCFCVQWKAGVRTAIREDRF